jgi:glutamate mutase epsilon subunit
LRDEKFNAIREQFTERDKAVTAALMAAEKAVDKQATSFSNSLSEMKESFSMSLTEIKASLNKQIEQLTELQRAGFAGLEDKINDSKDRLNRIEGQAVGQMDRRDSGHMQSGTIIAIISVVIAFAAVLLSLGWHLTGK